MENKGTDGMTTRDVAADTVVMSSSRARTLHEEHQVTQDHQYRGTNTIEPRVPTRGK